MSQTSYQKVQCPKCKKIQECLVYFSMNVSIDPNLKEVFFNNKWNYFSCECGLSNQISCNMMYHDMDKRFVIWLITDGNLDKPKDDMKKLAEKFDSKDNYFLKTIFVENRIEMLNLVKLCDMYGLPNTKEEREELQSTVKKMVENNLTIKS